MQNWTARVVQVGVKKLDVKEQDCWNVMRKNQAPTGNGFMVNDYRQIITITKVKYNNILSDYLIYMFYKSHNRSWLCLT